jgi:large subunit ribosomal protein L17
MKHRVAGRRLDRTTEHRTAMFRNMVTSLLRHERIVTTTPKAKDLRRIAEKVITLGKRGTAHARRLAQRQVRDLEVMEKLFGTLGPRFATRPGGYTRVVRLGRRVGDNADMAMIELVERTPEAAEGEKEAKGGAARKAKEPKAEKKPDKKAEKKAEAGKAKKDPAKAKAPKKGEKEEKKK